MYSYEDRKRAVDLYFKYKSYTAVIKELEYPSSRTSLIKWVKEFKKNKRLQQKSTRTLKYSEEEQKKAIDYYLTHGKCIAKTVKDLGYPSKGLLSMWISKNLQKSHIGRTTIKSSVYLSNEIKQKAVTEFMTENKTAATVSAEYGVSTVTLYNWKHEIFGDKKISPMRKRKKNTKVNDLETANKELKIQLDKMQEEYEKLQKQTYRMRLEYDALEAAAKILKKDQGISLKKLTNKEKTLVTDTLKNKYRLKELLSIFNISKSSYFYQEAVIHGKDKYQKQRESIKNIFKASNGTYGYRRIYTELKNNSIRLSEKVVRNIMKEENLSVKFIKRKKYSSYIGEITPAVPNLLNRDFHADLPNKKWLTDITEFHIPAGKVYLSPIIDCFDGLPVAWTIGTNPNAELVNTMLDKAIRTLKTHEKPIVHSDRGAHYRWPGWIERMNKSGLTRSMSKKGCSPDNSACEGFFGRLKNEMFYGHSWKNVSINKFIDILDDYVKWYATKRIKLSLGGMSPIDYRKSLNLIAN